MKILVVDDEERFARMVGAHLADAGYSTTVVTSGTAALKALEQGRFDVVLTDLKMVPVSGLEVLDAVKARDAGTEVVLLTAYGAVETAVAAIKRGAYDFLQKPVSLDEVVLLMSRIEEKQRLKQENLALKQELAGARQLSEMAGASEALNKVRELAAKVAPSDASVLILGESGVGKELVARLIHRLSPRAARPFVTVHAAALPETLLESELFGYEKGAFTGANERKPGRLELAAGGTLFLDEIGEITPALQVKLLRFMQEKTFTHLGGSETVKVDARIVAATNRDLTEEIRAGRFREDLYYRLAVFPIQVPALRERRGDIPILARHILQRLGAKAEPSREVLELLADHDWPGNVRELENVLERATILSGGQEIEPQHIQLPEAVLVRPEAVAGGQWSKARGQGAGGERRSSLFDVEKQMLEDALRRAAGNKSRAAKLLGITRRMLYTKLEKFGIEYSKENDE